MANDRKCWRWENCEVLGIECAKCIYNKDAHKVATIIYECSHSLRADGIYYVIVADGSINVQDKIDDAKAEAYEQYGDDWCLDDVWEYLDIDDYEIYDYRLAEV